MFVVCLMSLFWCFTVKSILCKEISQIWWVKFTSPIAFLCSAPGARSGNSCCLILLCYPGMAQNNGNWQKRLQNHHFAKSKTVVLVHFIVAAFLPIPCCATCFSSHISFHSWWACHDNHQIHSRHMRAYVYTKFPSEDIKAFPAHVPNR